METEKNNRLSPALEQVKKTLKEYLKMIQEMSADLNGEYDVRLNDRQKDEIYEEVEAFVEKLYKEYGKAFSVAFGIDFGDNLCAVVKGVSIGCKRVLLAMDANLLYEELKRAGDGDVEGISTMNDRRE